MSPENPIMVILAFIGLIALTLALLSTEEG